MRILRLLTIGMFCVFLLHCQPASNHQTNLASTTTSTSDKPAPSSAPSPNANSAENKTECHYSVGFDAWEPYQYIDVGDQITGLDIELVSTMIKAMGCTLTFQTGTWVSLLKDLKDGNVDILLGASKTPAREQYALFSDAYRMEEYSLYIRKEDAAKQTGLSIANFIEQGHRIGVVTDYYYGPEVSMLRDGSSTSRFFVPAIIGEVNVARLLDKDIDGFIEDSFVGASFLRRKALGDYIVAQGTTIEAGDAHIMFSKKTVSEDEVQTFNEQLKQVKSNNQYAQIVARYSQ